MQLLWISVLTVVALSNACQSLEEEFCADDLKPEVYPNSVTLLPEETVQATYFLYTCGGRVELEDTNPIWTSENTDVATVDATGLITAEFTAGRTNITMEDTAYDVVRLISVTVPVVDPAP